jgi:phage-related protein
MSIGAAINDLVKSFYELFSSILSGIYNTFHAIFAAVFGLLNGFVNLIGDVFQGAFDVVGGVGKFLISKLLLLRLNHLYSWRMSNREQATS